MKVLRSKCHKAPVTTKHDYRGVSQDGSHGTRRYVTNYYICTVCGEPADVIDVPRDPPREEENE